MCPKIDYTKSSLSSSFLGGINMTESNHSNEIEAPKKKISLQEAMKQKLEAKKNQGAANKSNAAGAQSTKKMQSQQTKKVSNQRRKMGV
jgi:hypothetical protein